ncbi:MAG: type II secretion system protein [Patescibacteria group bacterium]|jgi:type II secretory pathway pseudopilin PulG
MGLRRNKMMNKMKKSFGLIEVLVSGLIVISIVSAAAVLRQRSSSQASLVRHQEVATLLAQEGIEGVRQIRDSNYLIKQSEIHLQTLRTKVPWDCFLTYAGYIAANDLTSPPTFYCQDGRNNSSSSKTSTNTGDFSLTNSLPTDPSKPTLELSAGAVMEYLFYNAAGGRVWLPAFGVSSYNKVDTGGFESDSPSTNTSIGTIFADNCPGAERIFVPEGDSNKTIMLGNTRRTLGVTAVGVAGQTIQGNNVAGAYAQDCASAPPAGYAEFKRQITISQVPAIQNAETANYPADWVSAGAVNSQTHMVKVLVRVSWDETNRFSTNQDNAVLLATYLTDWRPN